MPASRKKVHIYHKNVYFQAQNHQKYTFFPLKTLSLQRGPSEGLSRYRLKTRHKLPLLGKNTHFPGKCCPRPGKKCTFTTKMCISRPQMPKNTHFPIEKSIFPHVPTTVFHTRSLGGSFRISLKTRHKLPLLGLEPPKTFIFPEPERRKKTPIFLE